MWRKSRRSNSGDCVECLVTAGAPCAMRDSKDPGGPVLTIPVTMWRRFVLGVKSGVFDR